LNKEVHVNSEPWKNDGFSEDQFIENANTGDILLFRGSMGGQQLIRAVTFSEYDHVAMILKFDQEPDEVYFIEATGNRGVVLNKWTYLKPHIGNGKFYEKLVYR